MKILISVSDQVWGRKHQYVIDAINGLLAYGHAVCPAVEEGCTMAAELTRRGIPHLRVLAFCAHPREATEAVGRFLTGPEPVNAVCSTGCHLHERRGANLTRCLGRHAIRSVPLAAVLGELRWTDVRWRGEAGSGFVFVPANSPNTGLPAIDHLLVKAVLTAQRAEDLLKLPAGRDRDLVNLFYAMGALVPNRPKAMC
ncbi:hypothetical protein [Streptomyces sp. NPDC051554]|uniref:hypothetical protein n=1 Tax=Streptomyces sp. NPDC051554 TaxID=3365656 RepID=UPI00378CA98B